MLASPRPLSDRETLDFLHRALSDIQRTNAQTLAITQDLIRFVEELAGPLHASAEDDNALRGRSKRINR